MATFVPVSSIDVPILFLDGGQVFRRRQLADPGAPSVQGGYQLLPPQKRVANGNDNFVVAE